MEQHTRPFRVLVTRDTTETCSVLVNAASEEEAKANALTISKDDPDLVWEQDDTTNASMEHYVTGCEEAS